MLLITNAWFLDLNSRWETLIVDKKFDLGHDPKNQVEFGSEINLSIEEIEESNKNWLKKYMDN